MSARNLTKRVLWPGLDLHTRSRRRALVPLIRGGASRVLDAGCGNGYLALAAARKGASVVAVSNDSEQIERNRDFFRYLGVPQVRFELMNLYDIAEIGGSFDQIFCIEVLEHISRDAEVVRSFRSIVNERGELILCCPNSDHPEHALGRTDEPENGWHVRDGYNEPTYRRLLTAEGFIVKRVFGVGGRMTALADRTLRSVRHRTGEAMAIPAFLGLAPFPRLDLGSPEIPYSLVAVCEADQQLWRATS